MGLGWVDMGSLGLGPSLQKQLVDRGHKDTGEGRQNPPISAYRSTSQEMAVPPPVTTLLSMADECRPQCPASPPGPHPHH